MISAKHVHAHAVLASLKQEFGFNKVTWAIHTAKEKNKDWEQMEFHERVRAIERTLRKNEDPQALILTAKRQTSDIKYSTFGKPIKEE